MKWLPGLDALTGAPVGAMEEEELLTLSPGQVLSDQEAASWF